MPNLNLSSGKEMNSGTTPTEIFDDKSAAAYIGTYNP